MDLGCCQSVNLLHGGVCCVTEKFTGIDVFAIESEIPILRSFFEEDKEVLRSGRISAGCVAAIGMP